MTSGPAGVMFYNNTILTETAAGSSANAHWRNNLFLGENSAPSIFSVTTYTNYSSSDYNGFRPNPDAGVSFQWNSPPPAVRADYTALLTATGNDEVVWPEEPYIDWMWRGAIIAWQHPSISRSRVAS
jgi:hypothetical protein